MSSYRNSFFWQSLLAWSLFLASIGALLFNSVTAFWLPSRESAIRALLHEASLKLTSAANGIRDKLPHSFSFLDEDDNSLLEACTRQVLRNYSRIEGGFYLDGDHNEFAGFAFPNLEPHGPHFKPGHNKRRDPPPREAPYIRLQAQQSARADDQNPLIQSRDVGPGRIIVATAPVGTERPALLVVWLMYRVTGPEHLRGAAIRLQVSTALALAGLISALVLTLSQRQRLKREQDSRELLHDELRRSEHLASLGLMLAQVAHEVRNPLAGIRSTAQLWERFPEMSHSPESLQAMISAVDRLDGLLTRLLKFSKSEMSNRTSINVNRIFEETIALIRAQAVEQGVQIDLQLDSSLPEIIGSESAIRQVLLNISNNSLQAMPSGGQLVCLSKWVPKHQLIQLEISDTGSGIDAELRSRLFEPFFTTRAQGTGLGLALCREIVLKHGGSIELREANPHGTICRITVPVPWKK